MAISPEIDLADIEKLCPELRDFLEAEIAAGNELSDTHAKWGAQAAVLVSLKRPFLVTHETLPPGVVHRDVNDPHWWKAEYVHLPTGHMLVCRFAPPTS